MGFGVPTPLEPLTTDKDGGYAGDVVMGSAYCANDGHLPPPPRSADRMGQRMTVNGWRVRQQNPEYMILLRH